MQKYYPEILRTWRETGWKIYESATVPGRMKKLPWSHIQDKLNYDILLDAQILTMPVLLIVGEKDTTTPPEHIKLFYDKLPEGNKEYHVIKDAPHTFQDQKHLDEIEQLFLNWIDLKVLEEGRRE